MKKLSSYVLICLLISIFSIGCGKTSQPAETVPASSSQSSKPDASSKESPAKPDNLGAKLSTAYADMMKNNKYFMKYKMTSEFEGKSLEVESTVAVSGDNAAVTSIAEGMKTTIISKGDTTYMINHSEKTVMEIPPGSPMSGTGDSQIGTDEMTFVSSGVEAGLTYEQYSTTDGVIKYYFAGKNLAKIAFEVEGDTMVMNIIEMSSNVSDKMFDVPAGYEKTTLPG